MTDSENTIVVGIDGSESANLAVRWASAEATTRGLALRVVFVFQPMAGFYGGEIPVPAAVTDELRDTAQRWLEAAGDEARAAHPDLTVSTAMPTEAAVPALLEAARDARMLVVGASRHGTFTGVVAGSTAAAVIARSRVPAVVVRERDSVLPADGPVVVGVDGSPLSERAVALAFEEASLHEAPLVAVHCWSDAEYSPFLPQDRETVESAHHQLLAERLAGWQEKYPDVTVRRVVALDRPRHQLLDWSDRARLVVVGSRGRGGFRGMLLGSTSQALITHAGCPILVASTVDDKRS